MQYYADRDYPEAGVEKGDRVRQLVLVEKDPLPEPGKAYLFATKLSEENGYHQITAAGVANERIDDPAERLELIQTYNEAKAEQLDPTEVSVNRDGEYVEE